MNSVVSADWADIKKAQTCAALIQKLDKDFGVLFFHEQGRQRPQEPTTKLRPVREARRTRVKRWKA